MTAYKHVLEVPEGLRFDPSPGTAGKPIEVAFGGPPGVGEPFGPGAPYKRIRNIATGDDPIFFVIDFAGAEQLAATAQRALEAADARGEEERFRRQLAARSTPPTLAEARKLQALQATASGTPASEVRSGAADIARHLAAQETADLIEETTKLAEKFAEMSSLAHDLLRGVESDLSLDLARQAHAGTSHDPERRAAQELEGYAGTLRRDLQRLEQLATTDEKRMLLIPAFGGYRLGYCQRMNDYLRARSRCMSTLVTGRSNFPVRSQAKKNATADKRLADAIEYRERSIASIRKLLTPELAPIMAGEPDAIARIDSKLAEAEARQKLMVDTNAAIRRHARDGHDAQLAALVVLGHSKALAEQLLKPDELKRIGYPDFALKNNSANIRRLKTRSERIERAKEQPVVEREGSEARFEDDPPANRVRIFFSGKPGPELRGELKSAGFRWTPSLGCWQAYRSHRTIGIAKAKAGLDE